MNQNVEQPNIEQKEKKERGKNIDLTISFMRHGDKDAKGELTELGYKEAKELGKDKEIQKDGIKMYTSPFRRTTSTVDAILEGIKEKPGKTK